MNNHGRWKWIWCIDDNHVDDDVFKTVKQKGGRRRNWNLCNICRNWRRCGHVIWRHKTSKAPYSWQWQPWSCRGGAMIFGRGTVPATERIPFYVLFDYVIRFACSIKRTPFIRRSIQRTSVRAKFWDKTWEWRQVKSDFDILRRSVVRYYRGFLDMDFLLLNRLDFLVQSVNWTRLELFCLVAIGDGIFFKIKLYL